MGMPIEPIETIRIPQATAKRIVRLIDEGYWKPGEALPPQRELAHSLGISLSSLREALQSLRAMGIVDMRQGEGTFVAAKPHQTAERLLGLALGGLDMQSVFDARIVLEGGMAYLAALRATDEEIETLFEILHQMKEAIERGDMAQADEVDVRFHNQVAAMANNDILIQISSSLLDTLERLLRTMPHTMEGLKLHEDVAVAIQSREPVASAQAMRHLIEMTAKRYEEYLKEMP